MPSNVDRLKNILLEHRRLQGKMSTSTPTMPAMHRLPRLQVGKSESEQKITGLPRTFMSSYNSVSKVPTSATPARSQTPSMFPKNVPVEESQSGQGHYSGSAVSPGLGSSSSTSTIDIVEEETKTSSKTITRTSTAGLPPSSAHHASNGSVHVITNENLLSTILSTRNDDELDDVIRRLKTTQMTSATVMLVDHVRRIERQAELREELLRRSQKQIESRDRALKERDAEIRKLEKDLLRIEEVDEDDKTEDKSSSVVTSQEDSPSNSGYTGPNATLRCRFNTSGCPYRLPSMEDHEERECRYRPTRCPSLTCTAKPSYSSLLKHIEEDHDGTRKGRDRICRNNTNHLISSYVNIDKEPIFYKTSRMTWVANELVLDNRHHFFLECMRLPPDWHVWLYYLGGESEANKFQVTITLFREEEYGKMEQKKIFSAQRSYTGKVISIHRSKEEIAENGLGFMVHDKQIRPLCGTINNGEEQLFGYEVTVYKK